MKDHTRGPWTIIPKGSSFADITISGPAPDSVTEARYMPIATVHIYKNTTYPCFYEVTEEERDANARLIAGAPDMLGALKRIYQYLDRLHKIDDPNDVSMFCNELDRVIKKVEGQ
jgi:hypothetical protein